MNEFRVYYDTDCRVLFYTTETPDGQYITITREQYCIGRPDAIVKNGQLIYTHLASTVARYQKKLSGDIRTSKYDINILSEDDADTVFWELTIHDINS